MSTFELRIYQQGQSGYVVVPSQQLLSGGWKTTVDSGYETARFTLGVPRKTGSVSGLLKPGRRIEAWGMNHAGTELVRLWSGRIQAARRQESAPYPWQVVCTGTWANASRLPVRTPLVFPSRVDIAQAFAAAAASALSQSSEIFQISGPATGLTTDSVEEAYEQPLKDATAALAGLGAGSVTYGSDVVGDQPGEDFISTGSWGLERLFMRPFDPTPTTVNLPRWVVSIPDPRHRVTRQEAQEDATQLVNVLHIKGGALDNGNLLYQPTGDNTRLDRIARSGGQATNLIVDPGFELNTSWTYGGGASRKADTDTYGPSDGNGKWFVLFDNLNEKVTQRPTVPGGLITGRTYTFTARLRQAVNKPDGSASTDGVELRLRFFSSGGVQIGADIVAAYTPAGAGVWRDAQVAAAAPATATQIEAEIICTQRTPGAVASTLGVVADNTNLYDASQIYQRGWFVTKKTGSSAQVTRQNWQALGQGGIYGPYAAELSGTSSDDYANDWWLVPGTNPNEEPAAVSGGQGLRLTYWLKRLPDGSANPKLIIDIDWRDKDGQFISPSRGTIAAGALTNGFLPYSLVATAPANATAAIVRLRVRGNGGFQVDAGLLRDSSESATEFVRGDYWESTHRASNTAGLTLDQQQSNALYGDIYLEVDQPLIKTKTDSDAYALATFKSKALPVTKPQIEISGYSEAWRSGQYLRAIGTASADVLPSALPIVEIEGKYEGGRLSTVLSLGELPDTRQRLLQRLLEGARGKSERSSTPSPSAGTSLSYAAGAIVYPLSVEQGGTSSDNAADAIYNLGLYYGENLLPPGSVNGHTLRWNSSIGQWEVYNQLLNTTTGVKVLSSGLSVAETSFTVQGQTSQSGYLARFKAGAGQENLGVFETAGGSPVLKITGASIDFQRDVSASSYINFTPPTFNGITPNYLTGSSSMVRMGFCVDVFGNTYIGGNFTVANATLSFQGNPYFPAFDIYGATSPVEPLFRVRWWNGSGYVDAFTVGITGKVRGHLGYQSSDGTDGASATVAGLVFKDGLYVSGSFSGGGGGVTSVGLALPSIFTVSGSPVTVTGTLTATLATQNKNKVFAGPTTGADAPPTFRALDKLDMPAEVALKKRSVWNCFEDFENGSSGPFAQGLASAVSSGGAVGTYTQDATDHLTVIGAVTLSTGSSAAGRASVIFGNVSGIEPVQFGANQWSYTTRVRIPTASDATNRFSVFLGFQDFGGQDSAFFRYNDSVNSGRWELVAVSNGTATAQDTGIAFTADTWQVFKVIVNAAGTQVDGYIDGTLVASVTTNIPTAFGRRTSFGTALYKSVGTTSRTLHMDFLEAEAVRTTPF